MNPSQVPLVYLERRWARDSPPCMLASTNSRSERMGGVAFEKSVSGVMSREA